MINMTEKFIPREKLSKKARKQRDAEKRVSWEHSPVTKVVESKKVYNRNAKRSRSCDDYSCGTAF